LQTYFIFSSRSSLFNRSKIILHLESILKSTPSKLNSFWQQKADDAAIPDQLWLHAFLVGYEDPSCLAWHRLALSLGGCSAGGMTGGRGPPPRWQAAMSGFRAFGLRFWRRRALRGYLTWRRSHIPWQSNLPTPSQLVRWRMGMAFGEMRHMCKWTAKGRLSYNKQWVLLRCLEEGAATVEAGYDAI
jgi:hypothetical protein